MTSTAQDGQPDTFAYVEQRTLIARYEQTNRRNDPKVRTYRVVGEPETLEDGRVKFRLCSGGSLTIDADEVIALAPVVIVE